MLIDCLRVIPLTTTVFLRRMSGKFVIARLELGLRQLTVSLFAPLSCFVRRLRRVVTLLCRACV